MGQSAAHLYALSCAVCLTILAHFLALRPYVTSCPRNTIHSNDFGFFNEVNDVIQREPVDFLDPELRGNLAAIGIRKGQPFKPDARMTGLLTEGVPMPQAMPEGRIGYLPHTQKPGPILVPSSPYISFYIGLADKNHHETDVCAKVDIGRITWPIGALDWGGPGKCYGPNIGLCSTTSWNEALRWGEPLAIIILFGDAISAGEMRAAVWWNITFEKVMLSWM